MSTSTQVEYWDRVAGEKTFGHPLDVELIARIARPGARVLDCGCGYGRLRRPLAEAGFVVIGSDPALGMARRAKLVGMTALVAEGARLPFADGAFDVALLFTVLTCVPRDDDQRAIATELARVLGPGGVVYVSDLMLQDDERNRRRYEMDAGPSTGSALGAHGTFRLEGAVFRHHERAWIEALFAGFDPLEVREIDVTTMNGNPARGLQWIGRVPGAETRAREP